MNEPSRSTLERNNAAVKAVSLLARTVETLESLEISRFIKAHENDLLGLLADAKKTHAIDSILGLERTLLEQELEHFANSAEMDGSLKTAISEAGVATRMVARVRDPVVYEAVDEAHLLPKNRVDGLPRDEARQFFKSHLTRLRNLQKARSSKSEKEVIIARIKNIAFAEMLYKDLQREVMDVIKKRQLANKTEKIAGLEPDF